MADRPHLGSLNLAAQGTHKRALFVCSGGMLRSATCAHMMAAVADWNTRNCGTMSSALPPMHGNLMEWAETIYCMERHHAEAVAAEFPWAQNKIVVMGIPDRFPYRDPELINLIGNYFKDAIKEAEKNVA
jgi:predicted protein tyrosine phosphatase